MHTPQHVEQTTREEADKTAANRVPASLVRVKEVVGGGGGSGVGVGVLQSYTWRTSNI